MTYGEIYLAFIEQHPDLKPYISDYRPAGQMKIEVWFDNGMSLVVEYNPEKRVFEL